jgi:hypothetical protein
MQKRTGRPAGWQLGTILMNLFHQNNTK